jgi:hypothetical protein
MKMIGNIVARTLVRKCKPNGKTGPLRRHSNSAGQQGYHIPIII